MDDTLLQLMEELVASIELREAGDPDSPIWEASGRVQRLEQELATRLRGQETFRVGGDSGVAEEALIGIG